MMTEGEFDAVRSPTGTPDLKALRGKIREARKLMPPGVRKLIQRIEDPQHANAVIEDILDEAQEVAGIRLGRADVPGTTMKSTLAEFWESRSYRRMIRALIRAVERT